MRFEKGIYIYNKHAEFAGGRENEQPRNRSKTMEFM